MKKSILLLASVVILQACHVTQIKVSPDANRSYPVGEEDRSKWSHFFIDGLLPNGDTDAARVCKGEGGVAFVETKRSAGNVFLSILATGIIYTPATVNVYCVNSQK